MKITRDDATWLYTVEWDDGRKQVLPSATTIIDSTLGQFQGFNVSHFREMFQADDAGYYERIRKITAGAVALMDKVKNAGHFGRAVHSLTELDDNGTLDEDILDPALFPILAAWRKFKKEHQPTMIYSELKVASKLGYAGTLDRILELRGELTLLEIKSRPYKPGRDCMQTMAYLKAFEETFNEKIKARYVLELQLDGDYTPTRNIDRRDWDIFRSALAVYTWGKNHE